MAKQFLGNIKGKSLEFSWKKTELGIRKEGDTSYTYTDLKGPRGDVGPSGSDGVGIEDIISERQGGQISLRFELTNKNNKVIRFDIPETSPFKIEIDELFKGNSQILNFSKPLSEYQLLVIKNNRQTATIPALVGSSFSFWYSSGTVQEMGIVLNYSGDYTVYGVKLNVQIAASPELSKLFERIERLEEKIGGIL